MATLTPNYASYQSGLFKKMLNILLGILFSFFLISAAYAQTPNCNRTSGTTQNCLFTLTWSAPSIDANHDAATQYIVQRSVNGGAFSTLQTVSVTNYTDTISNDPGNTQITYQVISSNAAGPDGPSNQVTKVTTVITPAVPNPVTDLKVSSISSSQLLATWSYPYANMDSFKLTTQGNSPPRTYVDYPEANTRSWVIDGLQKNKQYCANIVAHNDAGYSSASNNSCATTAKS